MEEKIREIIEKLQEVSKDAEFIKRHKTTEEAFRRHRKINAEDIIFFVLSLVKTTLPLEIMRFSKESTMAEVVPSSISKARNKLKYTAFEELFELSSKEIPKEKTFKGYEVLAIDGMQGELQRTPELMEKYKTDSKTLYPMFHAVALYDVLNKVFIKSSFLPAPTDERKAAIEIISKLSDETTEILLFDRGFFSLALTKELKKRNKFFVIRVKSNALREISEFIASDKTDEWLHIDYDKRRGATHKVYNIELPYSFDLRCVKIALPTGETEILLTNLNKNEFSSLEISELYNMRWGIETGYGHLKNAVLVEDFVGVKENSIKQEFYASLLFYNLLVLFTNNAQEIYDNKKNDQKTSVK